jgi:hypothetical protein
MERSRVASFTSLSAVIPAKAGIHGADIPFSDEWIPAFAGVTIGWGTRDREGTAAHA